MPIQQMFLGAGGVGAFAATGGDNVVTTTIDGTSYKIHTFLSSGTFTVTGANGVADILVIAGGGSGGGVIGAGGGAGGYVHATNVTVAAGTYTVTVGDGGDGDTYDQNTSLSDNGDDSSINITGVATAVGGECGAGWAVNGGDAAQGTTGQGYAGGTGIENDNWPGGGGGGASEVGVSPAFSSSNGGDGGDGIQISWATETALTGSGGTDGLYFCGGGGGASYTGQNGAGDGGRGGGGGGSCYTGTGGSGGGDGLNDGGDGASGDGAAAGANTGGGGGGAGNTSTIGGDGGSGIVVVKYAAV